tara:strand:+ start:207 stop:1022 length:816 start_codon:yes stop_codon:yes gene_type:complete
MQTVQRYLINNLVIAYVSGYHGRNSKVYDRRLTLHRGVSNPVTFTFKNEDQKAQDITSKTYEFNVIDTESSKAVITKTLTILDDGSTVSTKGDASTTITEGDLLPLEAKFYNYSVREVKSDGSREVTYADTGYAASGTIEVLDGAYPQFTPSTSITGFTATADAKSLGNTSSTVDGKPGINNNKALHTIAVYTRGSFTGTLKVQGTMATSPTTANEFFDITMDGESSATNTFSSSTGITSFNFTGVYQNVRFTWDNDPDNTGIVDKILYRQ